MVGTKGRLLRFGIFWTMGRLRLAVEKVKNKVVDRPCYAGNFAEI
jgi:hypothetical protein